MYDILKTASTKYMYADDIALMESGLNYAEIQQTLTNDNLDMYLQRWRLRLNVGKNNEQLFSLDKLHGKTRTRWKSPVEVTQFPQHPTPSTSELHSIGP